MTKVCEHIFFHYDTNSPHSITKFPLVVSTIAPVLGEMKMIGNPKFTLQMTCLTLPPLGKLPEPPRTTKRIKRSDMNSSGNIRNSTKSVESPGMIPSRSDSLNSSLVQEGTEKGISGLGPYAEPFTCCLPPIDNDFEKRFPPCFE
jgi:hypothetical protein